MNYTKIISLALAGLLATPALAQGGRTSRGPLPAPNPGSPGGASRVGPGLRGGDRDLLNDAVAFFKEHSPLRAATYDQMKPEQQRFFNTTLLDRYMAFLSAENDDLRKCLTRQMEIEDTVYDLKRRMDGLEANSPEIVGIKESLRGAVSEMVEIRFRERALRIARMGQLLAEERDLLEKDRANKDQIVDQRYEEVLKPQRSDPAMPGRDGAEMPGRGPRMIMPRGSGRGE